MVGAVAAGAVVASQTVSLGSVVPDLPAGASMLAAGKVASAAGAVIEPAAASPALKLSTLVLEQDQDPAHQVQALAKGVALAEERARPEPSDEQTESSSDTCRSSGFGGVEPHVAQAGHHLQALFGVDDVGGVASRPGNPSSDHPRGYALDFMVDRATGDALAAYAEENSDALGVKYIMWREAGHYDHVHISFTDSPGDGVQC